MNPTSFFRTLLSLSIVFTLLSCAKNDKAGSQIGNGLNSTQGGNKVGNVAGESVDDEDLAEDKAEQFDEIYDQKNESGPNGSSAAQSAKDAGSEADKALGLTESAISDALKKSSAYQEKLSLIDLLKSKLGDAQAEFDKSSASNTALREALQNTINILKGQIQVQETTISSLLDQLKPCKPGFTLYSPKKKKGKKGVAPYCVSALNGAKANYATALQSCKGQGASLCTKTQWQRACSSGEVSSLPPSEQEWIFGGLRARAASKRKCSSLFGSNQRARSNQTSQFRCCMSPRK